MAPRRVRLRLAEVARQAEVSEATVSRVLNNKPGVSESTRATVLTAIDVLGFEVPERLRPRLGALVGLITPELTNPIFRIRIRGIHLHRQVRQSADPRTRHRQRRRR